jgi:23S rRNA (uracil1939-C5)-methyltransferase
MLDVTIDRAVAGGRMLARHDGRVILVSGAIPGERVRVKIERVARDVSFAHVIEVLEASPDRREPAGDPACGGAVYAHIRYERQRQLKAEIIADAFRRIARVALDAPVAVRRSPERGYRVRARLHVRQRRAGFFREGTHALCDAGPGGQLLPASIAAIDATLAALDARLADCEAFVLSENIAATDRVIHVVPRDGARLDDLAGHIQLPEGVTGLTTGRHGQIVTLAGEASITDRAADVFGGDSPIDPATTWKRLPESFFQGNRFLVGELVRRVIEAATGERFVDLYAGVGLFAVALAAAGRRGLAVEGDRAAAADLATNAAPWRGALRAIRAPVEEAVALPLDPPPDLVVLDPPRTGVTSEALAGVLAWAPPRIVYVSCDPPTLARDAKRLVDAGYAMTSIDGFDLFPNTAHVEAVSTFQEVGKSGSREVGKSGSRGVGRLRALSGVAPLASRVHQPGEERLELTALPEVFGVPLDADAELGIGLFNRFDDPVRCGGRDDESWRGVLDRLMMTAVDGDEAVVELWREQHGEARVRRHAHVVRDRVLLRDLVGQIARLRAGQVLNQRPPAGHVQHLRAAADREQRHVFRQRLACQRELVRIALAIELDRRMPIGFAVLDGVHIRAAGQQHAVAIMQRARQGVVLRRQHTHLRARPLERADVIGLRPRHTNHGFHKGTLDVYILFGTSHPMSSSAFMSCART